MMGLCVTLVGNNQFLESGGSVQNVPTMICALFATTATSII